MRVATWNLEWAKPGTRRHGLSIKHLETLDADVIVTTEDSIHDWSAYPYRIDSGDDWGYTIVEGRRKVIAWSRTPWSEVRHFDEGALRGRLVVGATTVSDRPVMVFGVCIPWRDCHVRTGRRDRSLWQDHVEYCERLGPLLHTTEGPTIVAGDFNQRVPRTRQPIRVYDELVRCLGDLSVDTGGELDHGRLIDHVASSGDLDCDVVHQWPNVIDGNRLSDHSGVVATLPIAAKPTSAVGVP